MAFFVNCLFYVILFLSIVRQVWKIGLLKPRFFNLKKSLRTMYALVVSCGRISNGKRLSTCLSKS